MNRRYLTLNEAARLLGNAWKATHVRDAMRNGDYGGAIKLRYVVFRRRLYTTKSWIKEYCEEVRNVMAFEAAEIGIRMADGEYDDDDDDDANEDRDGDETNSDGDNVA